MTTETKAKLFAVRATYGNQSGMISHDYIFGYDPTVFRNRADAENHAESLKETAAGCNWGDDDAPEYYVQEIGQDEMWASEEIAQ
ncbi:hypothetical protein [Planctomycetes bacterium TBK1r]|uniref:Uncharacterized protein n=1 Tax=Stieleria magnilauensis TaxID=2527963 RepID=A0ABX5Y493_9BACT|nr:hypothetical protein TBK1r_59310 [Planctomycetes bacterium TBK1r]QDV86982.1 hypothetical protein TBK1r_60090 [Planctomycetes bacterium TBK1r]